MCFSYMVWVRDVRFPDALLQFVARFIQLDEIILGQECNPAGSVPSAPVAVPGSGGGVSGQGGCLPRGVSACHTPPADRMTDTYKDITLPRTLKIQCKDRHRTTLIPVDLQGYSRIYFNRFFSLFNR